jgi:hypothetical protein
MAAYNDYLTKNGGDNSTMNKVQGRSAYVDDVSSGFKPSDSAGPLGLQQRIYNAEQGGVAPDQIPTIPQPNQLPPANVQPTVTQNPQGGYTQTLGQSQITQAPSYENPSLQGGEYFKLDAQGERMIGPDGIPIMTNEMPDFMKPQEQPQQAGLGQSLMNMFK